MRVIFEALRKTKLTINPHKCNWLQSELKFLGKVISAQGVKIDPAKAEAVTRWQAPKDRKGLMRFLGFINYNRGFINQYAELAEPLLKLLRDSNPIKGRKYVWTGTADEAFGALKNAFLSPKVLALPIYDGRPFIVSSDASLSGMGATLSQEQEDGTIRLIATASKAFNESQARRGISERECMGLIFALTEFREYCEGFPLSLRTDHSALVHLRTKSLLNNKRLQQYAISIQELLPRASITHIPGIQLVMEDALSRQTQVDDPEGYLANHAHPISINSVSATRLDLEQRQRQDEKLRAIIEYLEKNTNEGTRTRRRGRDYHLEDNLLKWRSKIVIPVQLQEPFIIDAHDSKLGGHMGIEATLRRLYNFHWRGKFRQVRRHIKRCISCNSYNRSRVPATHPNMRTQTAEFRPWADINMDLLGPLPTTDNGMKYILTIVDRVTRWIEAIPLKDATAKELAEAYVRNWVCIHGAPVQVSTDQGTNFASHLFAEVNTLLQSMHTLSPAYSPWINASERTNQTLLQLMRHFVNDQGNNWDQVLPYLLFAYRTTPSRTTRISPFELAYGVKALTPLEASLQGQPKARTDLDKPSGEQTYLQTMISHLSNSWSLAKRFDLVYRETTSVEENRTDGGMRVGDIVWVHQPPSSRSARPRKLDRIATGPWQVTSLDSKHIVSIQDTKSGRCRQAHRAHVHPTGMTCMGQSGAEDTPPAGPREDAALSLPGQGDLANLIDDRPAAAEGEGGCKGSNEADPLPREVLAELGPRARETRASTTSPSQNIRSAQIELNLDVPEISPTPARKRGDIFRLCSSITRDKPVNGAVWVEVSLPCVALGGVEKKEFVPLTSLYSEGLQHKLLTKYIRDHRGDPDSCFYRPTRP